MLLLKDQLVLGSCQTKGLSSPLARPPLVPYYMRLSIGQPTMWQLASPRVTKWEREPNTEHDHVTI
jgi:hypothetical protein